MLNIQDPNDAAVLDRWKSHQLEEDLLKVEEILRTSIQSENKLPRELSARLVASGGKRIRPLLMCLTYRALEKLPQFKSKINPSDLHTLAAVAEWVHTATLFHDDVIDNSPNRRDMPAAHILHGNKTAILVGDYVYADAFSLLMERALLEPSRRLAITIKKLVEGELWQHQNAQSRELSIDNYVTVASCKTAALFAWAVETAAWGSGVNVVNEAYNFGENLGIAFQMADDVLDTFELNPLNSSQDNLIEWATSAPTLPVTIAAQSNSRVIELWKNLSNNSKSIEDLRNDVRELQVLCATPKVLEDIKKVFTKHIQLAEKQLDSLANPASLDESLQILACRLEEGLFHAQKIQETC
ncbi:MAG: polyprenyl synthetase family protein [Proteobacteria bacterium]|nr:polyprenyl synthetase family protein [Pseudomonadota bacterium]